MSDEPKPRERRPSGPFMPSQRLREGEAAAGTSVRSVDEVSLQDLHEIKLLLRGESVVDWHRLHIQTEDDARRLFALNALDLDDTGDVERIERIRAQAVQYVQTTLKLRLDERLTKEVPLFELPIIASDDGHRHQRQACVLLKVMHIIYHLDARELRTALSIADSELFALVEESVVRMFDELRTAGVPVVEFAWSRKSRDSLITKLLVKRETSAARVFDRLRFRVVVERPEDLGPTLHVMLSRCIPFNYVVPGQTVNNLVDVNALRAIDEGQDPHASDAAAETVLDPAQSNVHSSKKFRVLNFIADLPVRVDDLFPAGSEELARERGNVVFVLAEFQVLDRETAQANETGESAHEVYKNRQHKTVKERLLRTPGKKD